MQVCWEPSVSSGPDLALVIALTRLSNEAVGFRLWHVGDVGRDLIFVSNEPNNGHQRSGKTALMTQEHLTKGPACHRRATELVTRGGPPQHLVKGRTEGFTPICQAIFDLWRHLLVHDPADHTVILQLPQLLNQHLLRNRRDRALEFRETQQLAIKQVKQDDELLATFKNLERLLHPFGSGTRRVASILTIR